MFKIKIRKKLIESLGYELKDEINIKALINLLLVEFYSGSGNKQGEYYESGTVWPTARFLLFRKSSLKCLLSLCVKKLSSIFMYLKLRGLDLKSTDDMFLLTTLSRSYNNYKCILNTSQLQNIKTILKICKI